RRRAVKRRAAPDGTRPRPTPCPGPALPCPALPCPMATSGKVFTVDASAPPIHHPYRPSPARPPAAPAPDQPAAPGSAARSARRPRRARRGPAAVGLAVALALGAAACSGSGGTNAGGSDSTIVRLDDATAAPGLRGTALATPMPKPDLVLTDATGQRYD